MLINFEKWFENQDHDKFSQIYIKIKNKYWLLKFSEYCDPVNWKYSMSQLKDKDGNCYINPTYEEMMMRQYLFEIKQLPLSI